MESCGKFSFLLTKAINEGILFFAPRYKIKHGASMGRDICSSEGVQGVLIKPIPLILFIIIVLIDVG